MTTLLPTGTDSVTAVYSGDTTYTFPSTSAPVAVLIYAGPPDFTLTPISSVATVVAGQSYTLSLTSTPVYGYTGNVSLSCGNLPVNMSCTFTPSVAPLTSTAGYGSLLAIDTTTTPPTLGGSSRAAGFMGIAMFPLLFLQANRRKRFSTLAAFVIFAAAGCISGCSSHTRQVQNVAPGTYSITLQGTSGALTHTATLTLTVQ